jgi:hypothetical protein
LKKIIKIIFGKLNFSRQKILRSRGGDILESALHVKKNGAVRWIRPIAQPVPRQSRTRTIRPSGSSANTVHGEAKDLDRSSAGEVGNPYRFSLKSAGPQFKITKKGELKIVMKLLSALTMLKSILVHAPCRQVRKSANGGSFCPEQA